MIAYSTHEIGLGLQQVQVSSRVFFATAYSFRLSDLAPTDYVQQGCPHSTPQFGQSDLPDSIGDVASSAPSLCCC